MERRLFWSEDTVAHLRSRGERYPGGLPLEPEWAEEALRDPDMAALEPDPKSRMGASRFVGFSPSAGRVLTLIAFCDADNDLHLITAWPATGADMRMYREETDDGHIT